MRRGFEPWVEKIPWRRKWQSNPVILPGESHGQRSLVGYRPQRRRVRHDWGNLACTHTLNSLHSNPAGRLGGQTPEEGVSQAAHSRDEHRTQPPAWMIHWDASPPTFSPLRVIMAEHNLQSWSLDTNPPSPRWLAFFIEEPFLSSDTCLLNYWLTSWTQFW